MPDHEQQRRNNKKAPPLRGGCLVAGILGVLVLVVFLLAGGGRWLLELSGIVPRPDLIAVYDGFTCSFRGGRVRAISSHGYGHKYVPDLYVRIKGMEKKGPIPLREFPEELAAKVLPYISQNGLEPRATDYSADDVLTDQDEIVFLNGKIYTFYFRAPSRFLLSRSPEGPYLGIPCSKEELLRVFGPPKRWSGYRRFTP